MYLETNGYVEGIVGSASCFVFGADKVITHFDWEGKRVAWVEIKSCLGKLLLNREPFADLMLLSGCSILPPLPELESQSSEVGKIQAARSLMSRLGNDGHAVCLQQKDEEYLSAFRKARFVIKHAVVMTGDGRIEPKDADKVSNVDLPAEQHISAMCSALALTKRHYTSLHSINLQEIALTKLRFPTTCMSS